ncbi:GTPase-associated system all-helical protein GASH [Flavobacterium poyangense]|uniref:GTPase-associated system all-helical protein GASH n=1 Tax=Flavobacterium poyangense TaxID=2204302 RepID=UPI00141FE3FE|nr:GTPase-associated system all-helical protein GASH [Flavobacterium sp. JXAS1]
MESKLLQPFLQAGLLDLGDSDERLIHITKSIEDLRTKLEANKGLLINYTLVALDPSISDTEPVLVETEAIVSEHWKALRSKFTERPIPLLRAVILCALDDLGSQDAFIARIIYLTGANFYPYAKLGREKDIIEKMLYELGNIAEKHAVNEWSLTTELPELKISALKVSGLKFNEVKIDSTSLKAQLKVAASNSPDGYQPVHHPDQWSTHFAENATNAIEDLLMATFKSFADGLSPTSIETPINKFFTDFKTSLDKTLKASFTSIQAVERRSKLLWWKETLYSTSLENSYRTIDKYIQPFVMAGDLYQQLPAIVPVSVNFLLRDTILILEDTADEKRPFSEILNFSSTTEHKATLKDHFRDVDSIARRISLSDYFGLLFAGKTTVDTFKQYTGVDEAEIVSLNDIAVIVLNDFMAQHLTTL